MNKIVKDKLWLGLLATWGVCALLTAVTPLFTLPLISSVAFVLLVVYWPGFWLSHILQVRPYQRLTELSLQLTSSVALGVLAAWVGTRSFGLTAHVLHESFVVLTLALAALATLTRVFWVREKVVVEPWTRRDAILIALPFFLLAVSLAIRPFLSEGDSYFAISELLRSLKAGADISAFINRPGFIPYFAALWYAFGGNYLLIGRVILELIFYGSFIFFYEIVFSVDSKTKKTADFLFLLLLATPVVMAEVDIFRSQLLSLVLMLPALTLFYLSIEEGLLEYWLWGFMLAAAAFLVHDTGVIMVLAGLVTLVALAIRYRHSIVWSRKNVITLVVILISPCFLILKLLSETALLVYITSLVAVFHHAHWQWWFLNSYRTVDGTQLGWSGVQAAFYYLYNGIVIILVFAGAFVWGVRRSFFRLSLMPFWVVAAIYLAIAELFPRLGWFFYPNRAWPFFSLALAGIVIIGLARDKNQDRLSVWHKRALMLCVLFGVVGWMYVTVSKGGIFARNQQNLAAYLQHDLPANALIVSPQPYTATWMELLSGHPVLTIGHNQTKQELEAFITAQNDAIKERQLPVSTTVIAKQGDKILSETTTVAYPKVGVDTLDPTRPVYMVYSYTLFQGIYGSRDWQRDANDYNELTLFQTMKDGVVFHDASGIVIKIQ